MREARGISGPSGRLSGGKRRSRSTPPEPLVGAMLACDSRLGGCADHHRGAVMKRIFRISGAAVIAAASALVLVPVPTPALGQSPLTCQPSTVAIVPSGGNLVVTCTTVTGGTAPPPACSVSV